MPNFYEFFAGAGMVRAGLGADWQCLFANDFDPKKKLSYLLNWGNGPEFHFGDINAVNTAHLPGYADLIWGSFPCQDLSLAGPKAGLSGSRSSNFFPFWSLVSDLAKSCRAPKVIVIENVCGALSSDKGRDFQKVCSVFAETGYRYGALVVDAAQFVPQSRPRLFIVGVQESIDLASDLTVSGPVAPFHTERLRKAVETLPASSRNRWLWWNVPAPDRMRLRFSDLLEGRPHNVHWHTAEQTAELLRMMSPINLAKVQAISKLGRLKVGTVYRRTRLEKKVKVQRAEVRFDDIAGCLRTPGGGSSRQTILIVEGGAIRSRLISPRETARLMGLADQFKLPANYNDAYHLTGDGVVVPVVRHLASNLFEPIIRQADAAQRAA